MDNRYAHPRYELVRQFFKLAGANLRIMDPAGNLAFFVHQKAWKLKEDMRVYADEKKAQELFRIGARNILDMSAKYDIFDSTTNEKIGAFKRKGLKSSFISDHWIVMDPQDREVGEIVEGGGVLTLLRRYVDFVALFFPQSYTIHQNSQEVGRFKQNRNPFLYKLEIEFAQSNFDRRMGIAAAVLLTTIEGKQR